MKVHSCHCTRIVSYHCATHDCKRRARALGCSSPGRPLLAPCRRCSPVSAVRMDGNSGVGD
eukprot:9941808-Lingulodinium_polyedra.AAC.1